MESVLKARLAELKEEFQKGQERLVALEQETNSLGNTMLRISGAIQVLEELLEVASEDSQGKASRISQEKISEDSQGKASEITQEKASENSQGKTSRITQEKASEDSQGKASETLKEKASENTLGQAMTSEKENSIERTSSLK